MGLVCAKNPSKKNSHAWAPLRKAAEEMSLQPTSLMLKYLQVSSLF